MSLSAAVIDLFLAFGNATEERVQAFTRIVADGSRCRLCLEITCRKAAQTAQRMPSPAAIIAGYNDVYTNDHAHHLGATDREVRVGKLEAFWRSDAVRLILPHADGDRDLASFVAAQMWWSRIHPTFDDVDFALENPLWIEAARTFLRDRDVASMTEKAWTRARMAATTPDEKDIPMSVVALA